MEPFNKINARAGKYCHNDQNLQRPLQSGVFLWPFGLSMNHNGDLPRKLE